MALSCFGAKLVDKAAVWCQLIPHHSKESRIIQDCLGQVTVETS